jgi:gamma-glutamyltranspeptidase/glutathione hydrolase
MPQRPLSLALLLLLFCAPSLSAGRAQVVRRPLPVRRGMVVSAERHASAAGLAILKQGGNAVDAAVATAFALAVTLPRAGNLGGGGFLVLSRPGEGGGQVALDFRETAPRRAHAALYRDPRTGEVRKEASRVGALAVGVPGTVAGLCHAAERWGRLERAVLLAPAIRLAAEGFLVDAVLADSLERSRALLETHPETRRIFLKGGEGLRSGERFRQPELARVLRLIADRGPDAFYRGPIAAAIVAEMRSRGGLIDAEDLAAYRARERQVLRGRYRGHEVVTMPLPSSGGICLLQMLGLLETFPVAELGFGSAERAHLLVECMRLSFRDRAAHLGDPDFAPIPVESLLSARWRDRTRAQITPWARPSASLGAWQPKKQERAQTTHLSVCDGEGGAVSLTTTLNGSYGCGLTVPGCGFLLNNEMDDFASAPGVPNDFGLIQGPANAVGPRKRPLSSMTPTLLLRDGEVVFVTGSPGGPTIINTVLQTIVNHVDHGMDPAQAVAAPRLHHQWMPDRVRYERHGLGSDLVRALEARGHVLQPVRFLGNAQAIGRDPKTGELRGLADPRGNGVAAGY